MLSYLVCPMSDSCVSCLNFRSNKIITKKFEIQNTFQEILRAHTSTSKWSSTNGGRTCLCSKFSSCPVLKLLLFTVSSWFGVVVPVSRFMILWIWVLFLFCVWYFIKIICFMYSMPCWSPLFLFHIDIWLKLYILYIKCPVNSLLSAMTIPFFPGDLFKLETM